MIILLLYNFSRLLLNLFEILLKVLWKTDISSASIVRFSLEKILVISFCNYFILLIVLKPEI